MRRHGRHINEVRILTDIEVPSMVGIGLRIRDWPGTSPAKLVLWETMGTWTGEVVCGQTTRSRLRDEEVGIRGFRLGHL